MKDILKKHKNNSDIKKIQFRTHKYIRSQYNWFKLHDSRIQWFNLTDIPKKQIVDKINNHISLLV